MIAALWLWLKGRLIWAGLFVAYSVCLWVFATLDEQTREADASARSAVAQVCTPVTTIVHDAAVAAQTSAKVETRIIHVHDQAFAAASAAAQAIDGLPRQVCPPADVRPGLDVWRVGIGRVRDASGDDDGADPGAAGDARPVPQR